MVDLLSVQPLPETGAWPETIARIENDWYPTGGAVNPGADEGIANWQARDLAIRTHILKERLDQLTRSGAVEFTVGPGGQFATINAALRELSSYRMRYEPQGVSARIRLLAGFVMQEQVLVVGVNLSWVTITADDPVVTIRRAALTLGLPEPAIRRPAFGAAHGGFLPRLGCLFEMDLTGVDQVCDGIRLLSQSGAVIMPGCGVRRASAVGLRCNDGSAAFASGAIFSASAVAGAAAYGAGTITADGADFSNSGGTGVSLQNASRGSVEGANCSGCNTAGIYVGSASNCSARSANARRVAANSPSDIVVGEGGICNATLATGGTSVAINTVSAAGLIFA